ncbi:nitrate/nitrite transporter NrtS [Leptolyngbya sp. AN02str]|uniref:nitrate/nitrite transporter NrtS n=1 Tax=Leptolyngbya sp. AN02str TaxID=3423363 RepID=UPI003D31C954
MVPAIRGYVLALCDPAMSRAAIRVALMVGSLLLVINHGAAVFQGKMTRDRWLSAGITYLVPYAVNIQGQYAATARRTKQKAGQV